jgi:hypothetical protein
MARGQRKYASTDQRVAWLLENSVLWSGDTPLSKNKREIVNAMKKAGLVSPKTGWCDIGLESLVLEARRRRKRAEEG